MIRRTAPMTCCQRCEDSIAKFGIFTLNLIDFFLGGMFLVFGLYLWAKLGSAANNMHTAWLAVMTLVIGICLLLIVVFSFISMNLTDCKIGVVFSGYLALFVSISSIVMGITSLVVRGDLFNYLDENSSDLGLSSRDVDAIKDWYVWIVISLFCSFILEFIRYKWSGYLYKNYSAMDSRYQSLLALEEDEYEVKLNSNMAERSERYGNLRNHYKNKYSSRVEDNDNMMF